jgi:glucose/arabinose dehydrogenase
LVNAIRRSRGAVVALVLALGSLPTAGSADVSSNLLQNPGFENGLSGWASGSGSLVSSPVHSGTGAIQIGARTSAAQTAHQTVPVTGGADYEASGWIQVSGITAGARIQIRWLTASGALARVDTVGTLTGTTGWVQSQPARTTAPAGATQGRFVLRVEAQPSTAGRAWFDDLVLGPAVVGGPLPPGFVEEVVTDDLIVPTDHAYLPDGRVLVAEHRGIVRLLQNGTLSTFLDIRSRVNNFGERGLFGLAVDPAFTPTQNNFVYVYYVFEDDPTQPDAPKTARLSRFTVTGGVAGPASEVVLVGSEPSGSCNDLPAGADCIPSDFRDHHGGTIRFASDGSIFLSTGDGATSCCVNDNALRAQDVDSLAGKILRITRTGNGLPSNPFWNGNSDANRSKVWAYGLRNPFRFGLRPGTDRPFIGDVGWRAWEEIDAGPAGSNFGWPCYEGSQRQPGYEPAPTCQSLYAQGPTAAVPPVLAYAHVGGGASVTGGVFYSGTAFPSQYHGAYLYGDYALGWIRTVRFDAADRVVGSPTDLTTAADGPVDIEVAQDGSVTYLSIITGELRRIRYAPGNRPPIAQASATPTSGLAPLTVRFSSAGSSDPDGDPLSFSWDFGDGSPPSSAASPQHVYDQNGTYDARLTVNDGAGGTSTDDVTITVGNRPPVASIDAPAPTFRYAVGDTVTLSGSAVDPEDGSLPGSSLSWTVTIQHCPGGSCHTHPFLSTDGATAPFQVPDHGDDSFFAVTLRARDSGGLTGEDTATIQPQTAQIRLDTVPAGLSLVYDGETVTAPFSRQVPVSSSHTIRAPSPQGANVFSGWSDGGAQQHVVVVDADGGTFTATFGTTSNLLANPGFESGLGPWTKGPVVTSPVHSGTGALLIRARASAAQTSVQPVGVSGGTTYRASGWLNVADVANAARIQVQWRDASGAVLRTNTVGSLTGTAGWTQRSATFTAPPAATLARFILRVEREVDDAGSAWFDDVSFGPV